MALIMDSKKWNWQQNDWPHFTYDKEKIAPLEREYILKILSNLDRRQKFSPKNDLFEQFW